MRCDRWGLARPSNGQEVDACVGMIATASAFQTETLEVISSSHRTQASLREIDLNLFGPVTASARNLQPMLLPTQSHKRVLSRMEETRKTPARREQASN